MADHKTDTESPQFTIPAIERGIEKLRRRIEDVNDLDPSQVRYDDQSVKNVTLRINETLSEVFGADYSPKFLGFLLGPSILYKYRRGIDPQVQDAFAKAIPQTVMMLEGRILSLEGKREDLEAEQEVDQSGATSSDNSSATTTCKGHCPQCGPDRIAYILASERYEDEEELTSNSGGPSITVTCMYDYQLLRCCGCNVPYFQRKSWSTEDWEPYPESWPLPAKRERPDWVYELDDSRLRDLLREIYGALDANHRVLAAIGIRTALDQTMEPEGVDPTLSFKKKLNELQKKGVLAENDKQIFSKLIDAGSAAAHRDWKPAQEELTTLFEGMENYLQRVLVLKKTVGGIDVPPKRPKKDKTSPES